MKSELMSWSLKCDLFKVYNGKNWRPQSRWSQRGNTADFWESMLGLSSGSRGRQRRLCEEVVGVTVHTWPTSTSSQWELRHLVSWDSRQSGHWGDGAYTNSRSHCKEPLGQHTYTESLHGADSHPPWGWDFSFTWGWGLTSASETRFLKVPWE